tara:strand:+ start:224 stop:736 length:513 start_codon:yes stop_codon:yes gene_type:complete
MATDLRQSSIKKINNIVKDEDLTKLIEKSIHLYCLKQATKLGIMKSWSNVHFKKLYLHKVMSIYLNLKPDSYIGNTRLLKRLKEGEFKPEDLALMTPQHMFPEQWKDLIDEKSKIDKMLYETRTETATDIYKCGRCKKRMCTYYQLQTRSADEPMTTFVTCLNCGKRWKS